MAIPKEKMSAYERWEMSAFNDDANSAIASTKPKRVPEPQSNNLQSVNNVLESVRKEAYDKGMQEGYAVGMAKAREQATGELQQLTTLMQGFTSALETADKVIAESTLTLALDIAKAMLKQKIQVDEKVLLPIIAAAIHDLPQLQMPARMIVNHEDANLLRAYLTEEVSSQAWQVIEDPTIEKGGVLIETGANQVDASNALRWKRITEALSQDNDWLLP